MDITVTTVRAGETRNFEPDGTRVEAECLLFEW